MKNTLLVGMVLGVMVGAIGVSLSKPAQKFVRNSTEAIKDEAKTLINKNKED